MTKDEMWTFAKRNERSFQLLNHFNFADSKIIAPELGIYKDGVEYYDPQCNQIHIGTDGIVDIFYPEDKEEAYNATIYVMGHEEQHRRSTASVPYARTVNRGVQAVIQYIASVEETKPMRFRNDRDYSDYIYSLKERGIVINFNGIRNFTANIVNSLEDGRIERIRSARLPGFAVLRKYFRGKFWNVDQNNPPYAEIEVDPVKMLCAIRREILSLATCQLYSKGFVRNYIDTPLYDIINSYLPFIARAVMSRSVRYMEPEAIEIMKLMAPYIYKAFRLSEKDIKMQMEMEKMMAEIIKEMIEHLDDMPLDERDEDEEESYNSTFDHSDLVVTLPDDVYDKLMEKSKEKKGDGKGMMIRREHPKENEEEKTDESNGSSGTSDGSKDGNTKKSDKGESNGTSGKQADGDTKESGSDNSGESADPKESSENKGSNATGGNTDSSDKSTDDSKSKGKNESLSGDSDEIDKNNATKTGTQGDDNKSGRKSQIGKDSEKPNGTASDREKAIENVLKSIEEAKDITHESASEEISKINTYKGHEKKDTTKEVSDTAPAITDEEVREVMKGSGLSFVEVKRSYPVDTELPPVVAQRGKTLHRNMEKYFKSLKTPNVRFLDSGKIDTQGIYRMAIKDTDVFCRAGKSKGFDGCAYILIDNSGSMYGEKFKQACTAAAIIEEGFRGLFPIKIVAFNDDYRTVCHQVIKGWDESLRLNCSWNYCVHSKPGHGNADGCSIAVAAKELSERHEKKKLLVVLSDGAPTEGSGNPVELTKKAIAEARKKRIQVSGIYFEEGSIDPNGDAKVFHECYQKDYVLCPLSDLDKNLQNILIKFSRS